MGLSTRFLPLLCRFYTVSTSSARTRSSTRLLRAGDENCHARTMAEPTSPRGAEAGDLPPKNWTIWQLRS